MNDDLEESPGIRALRALISAGGWQPLPGGVGISRKWQDGSIDTLCVFSEDIASVERQNADSQPVWMLEKVPLTKAIAALTTLAAPGEPDAPDTPLTTTARTQALTTAMRTLAAEMSHGDAPEQSSSET